jgi:hypothetical protein
MLESQEAPGFLAPRLSLSYPYGVYQQEKSTFIKVNYNLSTYTFNLYSREAIVDIRSVCCATTTRPITGIE